MFSAVIVCAIGIKCGLTGEFRPAQKHASRAQCYELTAAGLRLIGENPTQFKIKCVSEREANGGR